MSNPISIELRRPWRAFLGEFSFWFLVFPLIHALIQRASMRLSIDGARIVMRTGFLSRSVIELRMADIRSVSIRQGFFDRLLGLGNVVVATAATGLDEIVAGKVANPTNVAEIIRYNQALATGSGEGLSVPQRDSSMTGGQKVAVGVSMGVSAVVFLIAVGIYSVSTEMHQVGREQHEDGTGHIAELDAKARAIPASRLEDNLAAYRELLDLDPSNERYKNKVEHYSAKIRDRDAALAGSRDEGAEVAHRDIDEVTIESDGWHRGFQAMLEEKFPSGLPFMTEVSHEYLDYSPKMLTSINARLEKATVGSARAIRFTGSLEIAVLPDGIKALGDEYMVEVAGFLISPNGTVLWSQGGFPRFSNDKSWASPLGDKGEFLVAGDEPRTSLKGCVLGLIVSADPLLVNGQIGDGKLIVGVHSIELAEDSRVMAVRD